MLHIIIILISIYQKVLYINTFGLSEQIRQARRLEKMLKIMHRNTPHHDRIPHIELK